MSSQFNGGDDDITEKGKSKSSVLKLNITMQSCGLRSNCSNCL